MINSMTFGVRHNHEIEMNYHLLKKTIIIIDMCSSLILLLILSQKMDEPRFSLQSVDEEDGKTA